LIALERALPVVECGRALSSAINPTNPHQTLKTKEQRDKDAASAGIGKYDGGLEVAGYQLGGSASDTMTD
jgi:hypothetical protein